MLNTPTRKATATRAKLTPVNRISRVGVLSTAAALDVRVAQPAPGRVVTTTERYAPGLLHVLRPIVVHLLVFCVLAGLGIVIYAFVEGGAAAGFSAVLWVPVAAGMLFVLSHLSAVTITGADGWLAEASGSLRMFESCCR